MFESNIQCESYRRMEYLIKKHCPRLMAVGDHEGLVQPRISIDSLEERHLGVIDKVMELRRQGYTHAEVAKATGLKQFTCEQIWLRFGNKRKRKSKEK